MVNSPPIAYLILINTTLPEFAYETTRLYCLSVLIHFSNYSENKKIYSNMLNNGIYNYSFYFVKK